MISRLKVDHVTLVVDLDGTFLASSKTGKDPLYQLISDERDKFTVIFATGRAIQSVMSVLGDPMIPKPDFIVSDVGATVVDGKTLRPIVDIQSAIEERWPGKNAVLETIGQLPGLRLQDVPQDRRCSFYFEEDEIDLEEIKTLADDIGCEVLISANRYLDILPKGVSKGHSVKTLLKQQRLNEQAILCAGDTLNDISLFKTGYPAVAVGGSEPALVSKVKSIKRSYVSKMPGTLGILDGLKKFDFIEDGESPTSDKHDLAYGTSSLVMVYHRQPFDEIRKGKEVIRRLPESPNGIIPTLMGFFTKETQGSWVAWSLQNNPAENFETHVAVDPERYPGLVTSRVPLTTEDVNLFYKRFSKEAFWPVIFSFPGRVQIEHAHWEHFKKVNRLFAERAAKEAAAGATVWVHDYNLWLVPGFLRSLRPDVRIAFFHHTSFPTPDIFNILPWRREIIGSLVQCDYVGFHIPRYAENFVDVVRSTFDMTIKTRTSSAPQFLTYGCALGVDSYASELEVAGRSVRIGVHPVGIDIERIRDSFEKPKVQETFKGLLEELKGRRTILSVERLDYVKGPIEKLEAFEHLLEQHPELHEKVVFINIVTPPAPGMDVYRQTREKLDQAVGRINGRFAKVSWTPIRYFYKSFPFDELVGFYAASDVAWITPLRDGLNLVCKEFVAAKEVSDTSGSLVLSEFAGASVELHGALLTNPFDKRDLVDVLHRALNLDPRDEAARLKQLKSIVATNNVKKWGQDFIAAISNETHRATAETEHTSA